MLIPIVDDIKADPFLAQLFIILLLPIVGLIALLIPFIPFFILYILLKDYVQKNNTKGFHSAAPKFTNRRQTLRGHPYIKQRKSQDRQHGTGMDSAGRYKPSRGNRYR